MQKKDRKMISPSAEEQFCYSCLRSRREGTVKETQSRRCTSLATHMPLAFLSQN